MGQMGEISSHVKLFILSICARNSSDILYKYSWPITIHTRSRMMFQILVSDWSRQITWPGPLLLVGHHCSSIVTTQDGEYLFCLVWMNVLLKYFLSNSDIWLSWSPSNCVKTLMRLFKVTCLLKPSKFEFTHLPQNFRFLLNHVSNLI